MKIRVVLFLRGRAGVPINPSDLPHVPLSQAESLHDLADVEGKSLTTVRKQGASTSGVDVSKIIKSRGGNPDHRPVKTGGFFMKSTPHEVAKERRRKKQEAQNIQY